MKGIFFNEDEAKEFQQKTPGSSITQRETDSVIFKFNARASAPYVQLMGSYVVLGDMSNYTGRYDTTWYTSEEFRLQGKALFEEERLKIAKEGDRFYQDHRWL